MSRPKLLDLTCTVCEAAMKAERITKKYCSEACRRRSLYGRDPCRTCRWCGNEFKVMTRADANRQYCRKECSKKAQWKTSRDWRDENRERSREHSRKWAAKNPDYYSRRSTKKRLEILSLLGGCCLACGVDNPIWLHVDYIPTCRGLRYRHPRGLTYVRDHLSDFRLLCANHHYELTLTGRIEGTEITQ